MGNIAGRVRIEAKSRDAERSAAVLARALAAASRLEVTPADASALSGLPLDVAEPALIVLTHQYSGHIRVTEHGDMLFHFASLETPRKRSRPPWTGRALAALSRCVGRVRDELAGLILALLGPLFVLGASLHLGALVFATPPGILRVLAMPLMMPAALGACLAVLALMFFEIFFALGMFMIPFGIAIAIGPLFDDSLWWTASIPLAALTLAVGLGFARWAWSFYRSLFFSGKRSATPSAAWKTIGAWLFGPVWRPQGLADAPDPLGDERRLTALIRERRGVITAWDLVVLFGWTLEDAELEVTRILLDYGGDVIVDDAGEILFVFDPLMRSSGLEVAGAEESSTSPACERLGTAPAFFGLSRGAIIAIASVLVLPLLGVLADPDIALLPGTSDLAAAAAATTKDSFPPWLLVHGVGGWPYLILLAIPLLRLPTYGLARALFARRRRFLELTRGIAERRPVAASDSRMLAALGGRIDDEGAAVFPDAERAFLAAERARAQRGASDDLGVVVFDSGDDGFEVEGAATPRAEATSERARASAGRRGKRRRGPLRAAFDRLGGARFVVLAGLVVLMAYQPILYGLGHASGLALEPWGKVDNAAFGGPATALAVVRYGRRPSVVIGGKDGRLALLDVADATLTASVELDAPVAELHVDTDGTYKTWVAAVTRQGDGRRVTIWRPDIEEPIWGASALGGPATAVALDRVLVIATGEGIEIHRVGGATRQPQEGAGLHNIGARFGRIDALDYTSFAGRELLLTAHGDGRVVLHEIEVGHREIELARSSRLTAPRPHPHRVTAVASHRSEQFATADRAEVRLWDVDQRGLVAVLTGHEAGVTHLVFEHDGDALIAGLDDGRLVFWSVPEGELIGTQTLAPGPVRALSGTWSEPWLGAIDAAGGIHVWRTETDWSLF